MHDKYLCQSLFIARCASDVHSKITCFMSITLFCYLWIPTPPTFQLRVPHDCHHDNCHLLADWINFFSLYDDHD